jgi:hypothetical protein
MQPRQALELIAAESWQLLASVSLGRIVFVQHAMPVIRPVNRLVDDQRSLSGAISGPRSWHMRQPMTVWSSVTRPTTWTRSGTPRGA